MERPFIKFLDGEISKNSKKVSNSFDVNRCWNNDLIETNPLKLNLNEDDDESLLYRTSIGDYEQTRR